jgi:hypothetical protein
MTLEQAMREISRLYGTELHSAMSQLKIKTLYENYSYLDFDWGAMECSISFDTFRKAIKKLTD